MFDLIILYVISAGLFTFGKQALINTSPFFLSAVRLIPSGLLFIAWAYFTGGKGECSLKKGTLSLFVGSAVLYSVMDAFRFIGLQQIPSSYAALLSALAPFIAALVAYFFFKESFSTKKIAALFLGFFGVLPLIIESISQTSTTGFSTMQLLGGYMNTILSVTTYVLSTFVFKKLLDHKYPISLILGITIFFGGIISLIVSLISENWNPIPVENIPVVAPLIVFIFITHNIIAQPLLGYLIKKYPVTLIAFASLVTPITSALLEYFLYGQPIGFVFVFSLIALIVAFRLFFNEENREKALK